MDALRKSVADELKSRKSQTAMTPKSALFRIAPMAESF
jgi:hypothetical protein